MFLPTIKQAVSKRLMHMQSICNVLNMSVTTFHYLSLPWDFSTFFEKVRWNDSEKHDEWTGKIDIIRQNYGNLPGSRRSMHSYTVDLLQALKGKYFTALGSQHKGPWFLHPQYATAGKQTKPLRQRAGKKKTSERRKNTRHFWREMSPPNY